MSIWKQDGSLIVAAAIVAALLGSLATWAYLSGPVSAEGAHSAYTEGDAVSTSTGVAHPLAARAVACFNAARAVQ
jgi:hypothetical protein